MPAAPFPKRARGCFALAPSHDPAHVNWVNRNLAVGQGFHHPLVKRAKIAGYYVRGGEYEGEPTRGPDNRLAARDAGKGPGNPKKRVYRRFDCPGLLKLSSHRICVIFKRLNLSHHGRDVGASR